MNLSTLLNKSEDKPPQKKSPSYGLLSGNYGGSEYDNHQQMGSELNWRNQQLNGSRHIPSLGFEDRWETLPTISRVRIARKTIDRYKQNEIQNQIPTISNIVKSDFPEQPTLLTNEIFSSRSDWIATWKMEQLEKILPEFIILDQFNSREFKGNLKDFKQHVKQAQDTENVWTAPDLPIMHQQSCYNSKKKKYCMGCSPFWHFFQNIQEDLKPWGNNDLLRFEVEHTETFHGILSMNGSFQPQTRGMLACDTVQTMVYSDDSNAIAIWGFISPLELSKLSDEDILQFYDQRIFFDPLQLERKVKVLYGIQSPGQTMLVPSMWAYFVVKTGEGISLSVSWEFLRLKNLIQARKSLEFNRTLGIYQPVNLSSLVISAAYQKLEEMECVETMEQKTAITEFILKLLPILRTQTLEEILGERINLSGLSILSYNLIVDKLKKNGRKLSHSSLLNQELIQFRNLPLPSLDSDVYDSDDETIYTCSACKFILNNSVRRTCKTCKGYDLCESCYSSFGKSHPHKMKRHRKTSVYTLLELIENLDNLLNEFEPFKELEKEFEKESFKEKEKESLKEKEPKKKRPRDNRKSEKELRETSSREREKSNEGYEEEVIDCICMNNKDLGFMISCEKCFAWLHGKCVGISKRNEPEEYYCPRCVKKQQILNANSKLSPRDLSPQEKLKEYHLS